MPASLNAAMSSAVPADGANPSVNSDEPLTRNASLSGSAPSAQKIAV